VLFFGAIAGIFDFASFSFHVPMLASLAKLIDVATRHTATLNNKVLNFMFSPKDLRFI
jgi:hypothetical protein